ncbi:MAG TPA: FtsX-like permease family protein, partial [Dehalococcoidia bacterium]|nr:FtsX-like permease family protein [Dehalococcoidia bacterium]
TSGGVRGALDISDTVDTRLDEFLIAQGESEIASGMPLAERLYSDAQDRFIFESDPFKADAINDAETFGSIFTSLFLVMGLFSIGAGILLIFLIFVLLAEERKSEMGISRAIGMRRWHLVETYLAEGSAYNVGSAAVGAVLGILVAFGMIEVLNTLGDDFGFEFNRHVEPRSLVVSAGIGIILVFVTVAVSSYRVSNLNIVAAIRDIPESSLLQRRPISFVGMVTTTIGLVLLPLTILLAPLGLLLTVLPGIGGQIRQRGWAERTVLPIWSLMRLRPEWWFTILAAGVVFFRLGVSSETAFLYLLGVSLLPIGVLLFARRIQRAGRIAHSLMGIAILAIWLAPFEVHETLTGFDGEGNFELFFLSGAMMVTGGTVFVVFNLDILAGSLRQIGRVFGRLRPVVQTAAAYPSTARFRTGMTVAMIAIIMFALVTFTTINSNFQRLFTSETATGGYAIQADANRNATFTDLRAALVDEGRQDLADQIEDISTLSLASFFGTNVVGLETQEWNERDETLVLDPSGNPIPLDLEPELAESALDTDGNPLPGAAEDVANLRYQNAFFTGADTNFLTTNDVIFQTRAPGFETDVAVWQALREPLPDGSRYAVVSAQAVSETGGAFAQQEDDDFLLPKFIEEETKHMPVVTALVRNPSSGDTLTIHIIAVIDQIIGIAGPDFALRASIIVDQDAFATLYQESDLVRHLTKVAPGVDPFLTAQAIEATLRVETVSIIDELKDRQDTFRTILNLFQGFTALGLLAGMAALGVIAVRAVVERRQQIGMLRAIGFSRSFIRIGMILEMSFIAALGVSLGTVLAVVLSWRLFSEGAFGSTSGGSFFVPYPDIALFIAIAM